MTEPILLYIVGGFLGAGKTTFLRRMLDSLEGKRVGLIINEFGSIGLDGVTLRRGEIKLLEINGGSIFCACLKKGFTRALTAFSNLPIDILLIENSGMADPGGMSTILSQITPYLDRQYDYRGMVCLIDVTTFMDYVDILVPVYNQAARADLLIINKADLANESELAEIREQLRKMNPDALIYETTYGQVPFELITELIYGGKDGASTNTIRNRPATYILQIDEQVDVEKLKDFCNRLAPNILRMKGFVRTAEGNLRLEVVCGQTEIFPSELREGSYFAGKLVLIGKSPKLFGKEIARAWKETVALPVKITEDRAGAGRGSRRVNKNDGKASANSTRQT